VQDYHFALLPTMIRNLLPGRSDHFLAYPLANPESFGICPWRRSYSKACSAAPSSVSIHGSIVRISWKPLTAISKPASSMNPQHLSQRHADVGGKLSHLHPVAFSLAGDAAAVEECRAWVRQTLQLDEARLIRPGCGPSGLHEGILERLWAVERLLELHPEMIGRFTLIQIAAPSRLFSKTIRPSIFGCGRSLNGSTNVFARCLSTVLLKIEHHEPEMVNRYYRATMCA